jgi:hypothetical protein
MHHAFGSAVAIWTPYTRGRNCFGPLFGERLDRKRVLIKGVGRGVPEREIFHEA